MKHYELLLAIRQAIQDNKSMTEFVPKIDAYIFEQNKIFALFMKDMAKNQSRKMTLFILEHLINEYYKLTESLSSRTKKADIVYARHIFIYIATTTLRYSNTKVASYLSRTQGSISIAKANMTLNVVEETVFNFERYTFTRIPANDVKELMTLIIEDEL